MNSLKIVAGTALLFVGIFGASVLPASAESIASCQDSLNSTNHGSSEGFDTGAVATALADKGIKVQSVEDWGGCAKVTVTDKSGNAKNEFFDPDTLQRLST